MMSMEHEAVILFVIGVIGILVSEIIISIVFRKSPGLGKALLGHAVCLLLAFACIVYISKAPKAPDGGSYNGSSLLALTGILWFSAEYILIHALISKHKVPDKVAEVKNDE